MIHFNKSYLSSVKSDFVARSFRASFSRSRNSVSKESNHRCCGIFFYTSTNQCLIKLNFHMSILRIDVKGSKVLTQKSKCMLPVRRLDTAIQAVVQQKLLFSFHYTKGLSKT